MSDKSKIQTDTGSYCLLIHLKINRSIQIGQLGTFSFQEGFYMYIGSGMQGLKARVQRHFRKESKKLYWHIDYFLNGPYTTISDIFLFPSTTKNECQITLKIIEQFNTKIIAPGFGASDCRAGCGSHLLYLE